MTCQVIAADRRMGLADGMPLIETNDGTTLHCKDWGQGQPLLFLAGWGLSSDFWQYQMAPLSDLGLRCVAYDRRGHGRSDDPGRGFDYDTLADDLAAVLAARGLRDVTLVAHSLAGGEVARYLSRHGSERVRGLVLVATALGMPSTCQRCLSTVTPMPRSRSRHRARWPSASFPQPVCPSAKAQPMG